LLVEDEAAVRTLTTTLLESLGYTVRVARGGEEATRIAAESPDPIHLVLTDMVMPGMGGREVADRLTARDPSLRVVYMSGFSNDIGIGQRALGEGVQLLQKPFTLMTLAHRVRQTLDEPIPMTGLSSA
jgi:CheY-like chemotaxis protein